MVNDVDNKTSLGFLIGDNYFVFHFTGIQENKIKQSILENHRKRKIISHHKLQLCLLKSRTRKEMPSMKGIGSSLKSEAESGRERRVSVLDTT